MSFLFGKVVAEADAEDDERAISSAGRKELPLPLQSLQLLRPPRGMPRALLHMNGERPTDQLARTITLLILRLRQGGNQSEKEKRSWRLTLRHWRRHPPRLREMWSSNNDFARQFRQHSRSYNCAFGSC